MKIEINQAADGSYSLVSGETTLVHSIEVLPQALAIARRMLAAHVESVRIRG